MSLKEKIAVFRIEDSVAREKALGVLSAVYQDEKGWVPDREKLLPEADLSGERVSWFGCELEGVSVGVVRVLYEIPFELYKAYGFKITIPGLDVEAFLRNNKIAEVGRFAVLPAYREKFLIAASLMRAAVKETVLRSFTHYITDVFESDPNTPYGFHKRVLGFQEVATHDHGELKTESRRVTMLLDFKAAYQRMSAKRSWIFRFITEGWDEEVVRKVMRES